MLFRFALSICIAAILPFLGSVSLAEVVTCSGIVPMTSRNNNISIMNFGAVNDGKTLNTKAFREAIYQIEHLRRRGGGTLLHIPSGVYLTGSFNLTSHMTLYLARNAVIQATQDTSTWPLIDPLPSYGRGRELPGGRYASFIHGNGLEDVVITGDNGTIDGGGNVWWNMRNNRTLQFTRPNLIEFVHSSNITISHIALNNSPFWNIHPVYCSNVVIQFLNILAPWNSPNTDGIDPDSSSNVCIEDCHIAVGDDLVAIKSGWDQFGINFNRPSKDITIRRLTGTSKFAGIAVGSETSGGIQNILAEDLNFHDLGFCIHIKTKKGRGGVIKNITISNIYCENAHKGIKISGDVGGDPDEKFNTSALPVVKGITIRSFWGVNMSQAGLLNGLEKSPFTEIHLSNVSIPGNVTKGWNCSYVNGTAIHVSPPPCCELTLPTFAS